MKFGYFGRGRGGPLNRGPTGVKMTLFGPFLYKYTLNLAVKFGRKLLEFPITLKYITYYIIFFYFIMCKIFTLNPYNF